MTAGISPLSTAGPVVAAAGTVSTTDALPPRSLGPGSARRFFGELASGPTHSAHTPRRDGVPFGA